MKPETPTDIPFFDRSRRPVPYDGVSPILWRPSAYALVVRAGRLLLQRSPWTPWLLVPGGEVGAGETLVAGAVRECYEETGLRFTPEEAPIYVGEEFFYQDDTGGFRHAILFAVTGTAAAEVDPSWTAPADEILEALWIPLDSLTRDALHPVSWRVLARVGLVRSEAG